MSDYDPSGPANEEMSQRLLDLWNAVAEGDGHMKAQGIPVEIWWCEHLIADQQRRESDLRKAKLLQGVRGPLPPRPM